MPRVKVAPSAGSSRVGATLGTTFTVACTEAPCHVAVRVTFFAVLTGCVVAVKDADVAPAGMVTLAGTAAVAGSLLDSATTAPPDGAGPLSSTVAGAGLPPKALVDVAPLAKVIWSSAGSRMVMLALPLDPL